MPENLVGAGLHTSTTAELRDALTRAGAPPSNNDTDTSPQGPSLAGNPGQPGRHRQHTGTEAGDAAEHSTPHEHNSRPGTLQIADLDAPPTDRHQRRPPAARNTSRSQYIR